MFTRHRDVAALLRDPRMAVVDDAHGVAERPPCPTTAFNGVLRTAKDLHLDVITDLAALVTTGTAVELIGNTVLALLEFPDEAELLRRDPSMLLLAIDEVLRYDPPEQSVWRLAIDDVELPSGVIPSGARVELSIAAANRDADVFTAPDRCIFGRLPNPHLSVVSPAVVNTAATVVGALAARGAAIELDGAASRALDQGRRRWQHLPVRVTRR